VTQSDAGESPPAAPPRGLYARDRASDLGPRRPRRPRKRGRVRRFARRPAVRVIGGLLLIGFCWVCFSVGQALTASNGGSTSSKLAEWARDHYLGPVVTFGEWLTYQPPKVGGKPAFSLADPQPTKVEFNHVKGFEPDIPNTLTPFAAPALPGEGAWRLQETVKGQPALYTTFLRVDAVHTSYVAGIASFDQRLVKFELRPGSQDPGTGFGGAQPWIPPGTRTGLLATFNGGFRLNASGGGFYLNGSTYGTLTDGAASAVYYRDGTIRIGEWGRDVRMTSQVVGVRQNLKLIVDHGRVPASVDQDVESSWGATLGGAYDVWRSGIGVTADGRFIYVYGPALSVHQLASLLQRAGAVEAMQLDINPFWTTFEYYEAKRHPSDPAPEVLLPTQESTAFRYYSIYNRDFTAVFAR
jgi:Phosphodiester glycosidase